MVLPVISLTSFTLFSRSSSQLIECVKRNFIYEQEGRNHSNPCNPSDTENLGNPSVKTFVIHSSGLASSCEPAICCEYSGSEGILEKVEKVFHRILTILWLVL